MTALHYADRGAQGGVTVQNTSMRYGQGDTLVHALRGVTLSANPGEVLMIRGPSGSGKTTLLQLMGALKTPTEGEVRICGQATGGLSARQLKEVRLRNIGFVFQFFNLFPTLKAWENVAVPLDLIGVRGSAAEQRCRRLLDELGLGERADFMPQKLSGGQRQRVAIARALAHDPPVVLADEPTAALDGEAGAIVTDLLCRLARQEGRVVVIVTHDARVEPYVDRIATIQDGRLLEDVPASRASAFH